MIVFIISSSFNMNISVIRSNNSSIIDDNQINKHTNHKNLNKDLKNSSRILQSQSLYEDSIYDIGIIKELDCDFLENKCCYPNDQITSSSEECLLAYRSSNKYLFCLYEDDDKLCPSVDNGGCTSEKDCLLNKYYMYKEYEREYPLEGNDSFASITYTDICEDTTDPFLCPTEENLGCYYLDLDDIDCPYNDDGTLKSTDPTDTSTETATDTSTDATESNSSTDNTDNSSTDPSDSENSVDPVSGNPCYCSSTSLRRTLMSSYLNKIKSNKIYIDKNTTLLDNIIESELQEHMKKLYIRNTQGDSYNGTYNDFLECVCNVECGANQEKLKDEFGYYYCSDIQDQTTDPGSDHNSGSNSGTDSSEWVNPCSNSAGCVWSNSTLIYSFFIITPGVNFPTGTSLGTYKKPNPVTDDIPNLVVNDTFGESWKNDNYFSRVEKSISESILPAFKSLYQGYDSTTREGYNFLSTSSKTNEIAFIAMDQEENLDYTQAFISLYYSNSSTASEVSYSESEYLNGTYSNVIYPTLPSIASLDTSASRYLFGFDYFNCRKTKNWKAYAQKKSFLLSTYQTKFSDIINKWYEVTNQYGCIFYSKTGDILYDFNIKNMNESMTYVSEMAKLFLADIEMGFQDKIREFNPTSSVQGVKNLHKFMQYDVLMYSMLHTYIAVQPLIKRIEKMFIALINNDVSNYPPNSKLTFFSVNEYTLGALYKIFNYNATVAKNTSYLHYNDNPYIGYEYNIQFELWKNNTSKEFYVAFRENMKNSNQTLVYSKSWNDFRTWLSKFYNSKGYTYDERVFFCEGL